MSPVKPMPTSPHPCHLVFLALSLSRPLFSPSLQSPEPPLALLPAIFVATLRCNPRTQSDPRRFSPSRGHPRATSPLGLTYAILPLPLFPFPSAPFPSQGFPPSPAPTILIVPASILDPLSFHLALFSGCANGVISALFSRSISATSRRSHVALDERRLSASRSGRAAVLCWSNRGAERLRPVSARGD